MATFKQNAVFYRPKIRIILRYNQASAPLTFADNKPRSNLYLKYPINLASRIKYLKAKKIARIIILIIESRAAQLCKCFELIPAHA